MQGQKLVFRACALFTTYTVCGRDGSAAMLAAKRSAGVAPEVNLREHITQMPLASVNKAAHSGFETQRKHHQKSKTGASVTPQFKKKKKNFQGVALSADDVFVFVFEKLIYCGWSRCLA